MDANETIRKWRDSMNDGRFEEYLGVYSPDAVLETPISKVHGREGVKGYDGALGAAIEDSNLKTPSIIVSGDIAAVEWIWSGKQTGDIVVSGAKIPAKNRPFALHGTSILHFDSKGLIRSERRYYDVRTWLEELGVK
jgi:hypothetical protein